MRSHAYSLLTLIGLGLVTFAALPTPAAETVDADRIAKLIDQLGSSNFEDREQATKDLDAVGGPALDALRKAVQSDDAEVRRRAEELVVKIEKRSEAARILTPSRLHLVYRDMPVAEAVADIAKKTKYNIILNDPQKKLADRKITVDTGEKSFWEAFDQFCDKAGLVMNPKPPAPPRGLRQAVPAPAPLPAAPNGQANGGPGNGIAPQAAQAQAGRPAAVPVAPPVPAPPPNVPGAVPGAAAGAPPAAAAPAIRAGVRPNMQNSLQITLIDGKGETLPTCYAGAVRIQVLPGAKSDLDELPINLQMTAEPKLQWQSRFATRIDRAVDDQGQTLTESTAVGKTPAPAANPIQVVRAAAGVRMVAPPVLSPGLQLSVPLRLNKGEKKSGIIKELTGSVSTQVQTAPEPLITVDNILKAAGQIVKGKEGGQIKVIEAKRQDNGQVRVIIEMEAPAGFNANIVPAIGVPGGPIQILPAGQAGGVQQIQVQIQAAPGIAIAPMPLQGNSNLGLTLLDEKDQVIPLTNVATKAKNNGNVVTYEYFITCKLKKDQPDPVKLVYSGSRSIMLDIPFSLKNVPLQ